MKNILVATFIVLSNLAFGFESSSLRNNLISIKDPTLIVQASDGSTISLAYDPFTETLYFHVNVKIGTFIALGFGSTMTDTEIIMWSA